MGHAAARRAIKRKRDRRWSLAMVCVCVHLKGEFVYLKVLRLVVYKNTIYKRGNRKLYKTIKIIARELYYLLAHQLYIASEDL